MTGDLFEQAFERLMLEEGGFVDNAADPGGPTKYGITLATLRRHAGQWGIPEKIDAEAVKALTLDQAKKIYRQSYWPHVVAAHERHYALFVPTFGYFDAVVNMGPARAAALLEEAQREALEFAVVRCRWYARLAARRPSLRQFLPGWILRACRYA